MFHNEEYGINLAKNIFSLFVCLFVWLVGWLVGCCSIQAWKTATYLGARDEIFRSTNRTFL